MAELSIVQLGAPILRKKAKPVERIDAKSIQQLIDDIMETITSKAFAIAAPQVNQLLRLFVAGCKPTANYPDAPTRDLFALINPVIETRSAQQEMGWEHCLSAPDTWCLVPRATAITMRYRTRQDEECIETFEGFFARILQHEYDHLDGIMCQDRVGSPEHLLSTEKYQRLRASGELPR